MRNGNIFTVLATLFAFNSSATADIYSLNLSGVIRSNVEEYDPTYPNYITPDLTGVFGIVNGPVFPSYIGMPFKANFVIDSSSGEEIGINPAGSSNIIGGSFYGLPSMILSASISLNDHTVSFFPNASVIARNFSAGVFYEIIEGDRILKNEEGTFTESLHLFLALNGPPTNLTDPIDILGGSIQFQLQDINFEAGVLANTYINGDILTADIQEIAAVPLHESWPVTAFGCCAMCYLFMRRKAQSPLREAATVAA